MRLTINPNTYNAIMSNALRAFERESWLTEASDMADAGLGKPSEIIEGMFSPFCDRLIEASEFERTPENIERARVGFFAKFTELAI